MLTGNTTVPYRYDGGFGKAAPSAPITLLNNSTGGAREPREGKASDTWRRSAGRRTLADYESN